MSGEVMADRFLIQYKHGNFRTVPELIVLKICYTESGIKCKTRIEREIEGILF